MAALTTEEKEGVLVVHFGDAKILEDTKIQQIGKELLEAVSRVPNGKLLLNFANVSFMSSAMIGKLVLLHKKCQSDGVKLKLCSISKNLAEVFRITNLNKMLDIQKDEEKAIKSFDKKAWFG